MHQESRLEYWLRKWRRFNHDNSPWQRWLRKWRWFNHQYGLRIFLVIATLVVLGLVTLLLYKLATPNWTPAPPIE